MQDESRNRREPESREGVERREEPSVQLATSTPLLEERDAEELRLRWERVQKTFVDDPKRAVAEADGLVDDVISRATDRLSAHRRHLEEQWDRGEEATTEDLRVTLQRYRSFFQRMLSTELALRE